ncbi:VCBS repeat-containing protein [Corallococcus exiguus]|uniref:M57 family metalloprotease n=1 Tax=Corallococcus exiguus TaxID=83462 RepID=UPI001A8D7AFE|nr:M57 family metalloprotease [Corallococcus exiguus]MBN8468218.1 VCBS repeat-containing protein [Corallococcus exiguus]
MFKKKAAALAVSCGALLISCGADPAAENEEIVSNLIEAGFPANDIQVFGGAVYVGRDAHVTLEASREMLQAPEGSAEQYRTTNLVGSGVTKICINPTAAFNSFTNLSQGLDLAIANYNERGLRITFARGPASDCTANITAQTATGTGGQAGFPSGGLPYANFFIGTGLNSYSVDVNEHVITHEVGHAIGFRHSDYYNRGISCGSGGDEGDAGVGAIHIPGTPTTTTVGGSIMNSCFRSTETGEWTSSDIAALNYLYALGAVEPGMARKVSSGGFTTGYWADGATQFLPGDFNGDGKVDFIAIHPGSGTYANTLLSNGDGTFRRVTSGGFTPGYWADGATRFLPGDFNGDGKADVIVIHPRNGTYANTLLSNGDGTFRLVASGGFTTGYWADGATQFHPGDFNGDGKADFIAIHPGNGTFANTLLSNGDGTFRRVVSGGFTAGYWADGATQFHPGDFNGDGKVDVITIHPRNGTYANTLLSNGDGTFRLVTSGGFTPGYWADGATRFLPGDFNGDGKVDFIAIHPGNGTYANTLLSNGDGTFRLVASGGFNAGYWADGITRFLPGDFNGDGKADFIAIHPGNGTYANTLLSNSDGTFRLVASGGFAFDYWADGATRFLPGDFSGDSKADFIAIHPRNGTYAYTFLMH